MNANATVDCPWLSTYCRSTSSSVQWRNTPWIMLATSDEEGDFSCEWMPLRREATLVAFIEVKWDAGRA